MKWVYEQGSGLLRDTTNAIIGAGYSGHDEGRMDPGMQDIPNEGPIPRGEWIIGKAITHPKLGPLAIPLTPAKGTLTLGRSGFFIHGDSSTHPGLASDGCIVLAQVYRQKLAQAHGDILTVAF